MRIMFLLNYVLSGALLCLAEDMQDLKLQLGPCVVLLKKETCDTHLSFQLYNYNYKESPKELDVQSPDTGEGFDPSLPFKIIIPGYGGGIAEVDPTPNIREAYLKKQDTNVLVVNYPTTTTINIYCYPTSVCNTWFVAYCTAKLLLNLEKNYPGFLVEHSHVIGFSLGAHIAAYTSNKIFSATKRKFYRITALDPARPLYSDTTGPSRKDLDAGDADFVDMIHTNAGNMGKMQPNGHVDFYLNSGVYQPLCDGDNHRNLCSHLLAPVYFAESINSKKGFWGVRCKSIDEFGDECGWNDTLPRTPMGDLTLPGTTGIYLVKTNKSSPFALG